MKKYLIVSVIITLPLLVKAKVSVTGDIVIKGGNNRNYIQASAFLPISETDQNLVFSDIRLLSHLPHGKSKIYKQDTHEGNLGIGYRRAIFDNLIAGGALYYDVRKSNIKGYFSSATINGHVLTPTWQVTANIYFPVGNTKKTKQTSEFTGNAIAQNTDVFFVYKNNTITEKAASGFDLRVSNEIGDTGIRVTPIIYSFKANKSFTGGGLSVKWQAYENINFETGYTYDKVRKHNVVAGVRIALGNNNYSSKTKLLSTKVERDLDIVTDLSRDGTNFTKDLQKDIMAIHQNDLSDINDVNNSTKNQELLQKLQLIEQNNGTLILVDKDDTEINFEKAKKVAKKELNDKVLQAESTLSTKASNSNGIDQINTEAASISNPLERQITILAAQKLYQKAKKDNSINRIAKSDIYNHDISLINLWKKYSTSYEKGGVSFSNIPGVPKGIEINRAGTLVLVKKDGKIYGILGSEVHVAGGGGWFSGGSEKVDKDIYDTIIRETFEESSGSIAMSRNDIDNAIKDGRYFYNAKNKTFCIIHSDVHNYYDIEKMNKNYKNIIHNTDLQNGMKEMDEYHYVSIDNLRQFHTKVSSSTIGANRKARTLQTVQSLRGLPSTLRINPYYSESFVKSDSLNALNKAANKF